MHANDSGYPRMVPRKTLQTDCKNLGFKTWAPVRQLSLEFNDSAVNKEFTPTIRSQYLDWSKHEAAPLCHVINNLINSAVLSRLYTKPDNRAELDRGRHDPWAAEFADLFNDNDYIARIPQFVEGVTG